MDLTITGEFGGVKRDLQVAVDKLSDLDKPLRRLDKYIRIKVQRRFDQAGPGWPPLQQKSQDRNVGRKMRGLGRKLQRELARAEKKAKNVKTVERRKLVLAEFKRLEAGGQIDKSLLPAKQSSKLQARIGRAQNKAKAPLGRIASSIKSDVKNGTLRVYSEIEWAGVHNEGGSAGRGSEIPKREFLALEDDDFDALESFILDELGDIFGE